MRTRNPKDIIRNRAYRIPLNYALTLRDMETIIKLSDHNERNLCFNAFVFGFEMGKRAARKEEEKEQQRIINGWLNIKQSPKVEAMHRQAKEYAKELKKQQRKKDAARAIRKDNNQ